MLRILILFALEHNLAESTTYIAYTSLICIWCHRLPYRLTPHNMAWFCICNRFLLQVLNFLCPQKLAKQKTNRWFSQSNSCWVLWSGVADLGENS